MAWRAWTGMPDSSVPVGAVELGAVVDLDQHVHAVGKRGLFDVPGRAVVERGHDDQDAVGAVGTGLRHLVGIEHEVLAEHRKRGRRARRHHEIEVALERRRVGEHGKAGGAAGLVRPGEQRRIEIGPYQPLGGRSLLDLGNQPVVAVGVLLPDRPDESARGRRGPGQRLNG